MRHVPHPVVVITSLDFPNILQSESEGLKKRVAEVPKHWSSKDAHSIHPGTQTSNPDVIGPIARAMTASSFTSLTLNPRPTILFNVTLPSRSHKSIIRHGRFNVHILSADEQGARIADLFAKGYSGGKNDPPPSYDPASRRLGMLAGLKDYGIEIIGPNKWESKWKATLSSPSSPVIGPCEYPAPLLRGPGILHVLKCELYQLQLVEEWQKDGKTSKSANSPRFALVAGQVEDIESAVVDEQVQNSSTVLSYVDGAYRAAAPTVMRHAT